MYKVIVFLFITYYHLCHILFLSMILLRLLAFVFCLHKELATTTNMVVKLYCEDVPQEGDRSPTKMQKLIGKGMEQVKKERYLAFYKHFMFMIQVLGPNFCRKFKPTVTTT